MNSSQAFIDIRALLDRSIHSIADHRAGFYAECSERPLLECNRATLTNGGKEIGCGNADRNRG